MKRERNTQTIEAEMRKEQESLKKAQDKIRSLNAELTTAKKREKARRYNELGSTIEEVLGVGELSRQDLQVLVDYFQMPVRFNNGTSTTRAAQVSKAIKTQRAKISAAGRSSPNEATSADPKPEAVPSGRQGTAGDGRGRQGTAGDGRGRQGTAGDGRGRQGTAGKFRLLDSHSLRSGHPGGFPGTVDAPRITLPGNLQGGLRSPLNPWKICCAN